jgi:hypothetical protein
MWGVYTHSYVAFPLFAGPRGTVLTAPSPDELAGKMRRQERTAGGPQVAGPQVRGPQAAVPPPGQPQDWRGPQDWRPDGPAAGRDGPAGGRDWPGYRGLPGAGQPR